MIEFNWNVDKKNYIYPSILLINEVLMGDYTVLEHSR